MSTHNLPDEFLIDEANDEIVLGDGRRLPIPRDLWRHFDVAAVGNKPLLKATRANLAARAISNRSRKCGAWHARKTRKP